MLPLPASTKIYLYSQPTDMRKGHDGLMAIVRNHLKQELFTGHLFVFLSRRRDRAKILYWHEGGLVLFYKRLERGRFQAPRIDPESQSVEISSADLTMLLSGIDLSRVKRQSLFDPRSLDRN